jgi:biotin synthase
MQTAAERVSKDSPPQRQWTAAEIQALFELPFNDLLFRAQQVHREHFDANQRAALDPAVGQDRRLLRGLRLLLAGRAPRYRAWKRSRCWRSTKWSKSRPGRQGKGRQPLLHGRGLALSEGQGRGEGGEMVRAVNALGLETCATLGMFSQAQAQTLKAAGLDYYNHNLDTAPEFYGEIITHPRLPGSSSTRSSKCARPGIKSAAAASSAWARRREERAGLLAGARQPARTPPPESVPINRLVQVRRHAAAMARAELDPLEFVRTIAVARITMPQSVRLSAGRSQMSDELQALCFLAGANSIFYGEKLLTTGNPEAGRDEKLFERLGLNAV